MPTTKLLAEIWVNKILISRAVSIHQNERHYNSLILIQDFQRNPFLNCVEFFICLGHYQPFVWDSVDICSFSSSINEEKTDNFYLVYAGFG